MEALLKAIMDMIINFFSTKEDISVKPMLDYIPQFGDKSRNTMLVQQQLNKYMTLNLKEDGDFGPATLSAVQAFQKSVGLPGSGKLGTITIKELGLEVKGQPSTPTPKPVTQTGNTSAPWFDEMKKHEGKHESNTAFQNYMNPFWKLSGLDFKGLVGSARAWCGLFVFMGLTVWGFQTPVNSFRAKAWDGWGHSIDWKKDGLPKAAIVRLNSRGDCTSASNNHLTTPRGDCTAQDLAKANATFAGFGGNQGNSAKVSVYRASTICYVGWPNKKKDGTSVPKPGPVTVSKGCTATGDLNESTR